MSASSTAMTSSPSMYGSAFWELLWRASGIGAVVFAIIAWFIYGSQPHTGAPADALVAFYQGERTRILIGAIVAGFATLNLMWFAAAIRITLADAGKDGWGAAATASSAAVGGLFVLLIAASATLAYSTAAGNQAFTSGLNDFGWGCWVVSSFPRAMLIMSGTLGLWRAGLISNGLFSAGLAALVLVLLGGTTWLSDGFWSPYGAYSRFISPIIGLVWILVVSRILLTRIPNARAGW